MIHRRHALRAAALSLFALTLVPGNARAAEAGKLRIGFQKSSTLIALLKEDSALEKALAPLNVTVTWHEFTSGLPIMEALNAGQIDVSADVADTVPIFAQAAQARIAYIAQEAASPAAQAILVAADSPIRSVADLKGRKVAVTKGAGSHYLLLAALAAETLPFKAISPAYLTPSDGRAALASGSVEAWVAWDPFLSAAEQQTGRPDPARRHRPVPVQALLPRRGRLRDAARRRARAPVRQAARDRGLGEGQPGRRRRPARRPVEARPRHRPAGERPAQLSGRARDPRRPRRAADHRGRLPRRGPAPPRRGRRGPADLGAAEPLIGPAPASPRPVGGARGRTGQRMPPLAVMFSPVSQRASSEARKATTSAMSPGWPARPSGVCATKPASISEPVMPALCVPSVTT